MWPLTLVIGVGGAVAWMGWAAHMPALVGPITVPWAMLAVGFAFTEVLLIHFEFRSQSQALTLGEVPLLIGLVFCSPIGVLVARLLGSTAALVGYFRQSPTKLAFNLAMHAAKVAVALTVYRAVLGGAIPVSPQGWLAAFAAAGAADAFSHICILGAITVTGGRPSLAMLSPMATACVVVAITNTSLALLTTLVVWYDASASWLLVVVALVFAFGYRSLSATRRRYASLELLYGFTRKLAGVRGEPETVSTMLTEASSILRAERAELALAIGGDLQRSVLGAEGPAITEVVPAAGTLEELVMTLGAPVLVSRTTRDANLSSLVAARGWRDAIAVPVSDSDGVVGVLLVADRLGEVTTFDREDLRLFEALANHAGVALHGGQLLERLRQEVAAKNHQALHDQLTGLPNRTLFAQRVKEALDRVGPDEQVAVMLMDLDQFKEVNDTLGHHTGDTLLKRTALRLHFALGDEGTIARLGGDEFAVVVPAVRDAEQAVAMATELRNTIESAMDIEGLVITARASIGVALAPEHGDDASTLLQRADVAMYAAKAARSGVNVYDVADDHYSERRLALISELRRAIDDGELQLHYQPQVVMDTGVVSGVEALVRWDHPRHGFVAPDEFIPLAEHSGLIRPLTSWVLDTGLAQIRAWADAGIHLALAVNVSPANLADSSLAQEIAHLLRKHGVAPSRLVLELTETGVMTDVTNSLELLDRLAATGIGISIDDFGTGYSSLARLAKLPVDEVKIDRSFVMAMSTDPSAAAIVRSTVDLSRNLGLRAVAEGVEDLTSWRMLVALGCASAQGYLISRPLPAAQFAEWLTRRREELEGDVVGIAERHAAAVVGVDDTAVLDPEFV